MTRVADLLAKTRLDSLLDYSPETGLFHWKTTGKGRRNDRLAGSPNRFGYTIICVDWTRYVAHRLAWLTTYGEWPKLDIDHIDRNPANNRISNLRDVSHSLNIANTGVRADNSSGVRGVCWDWQKLKWKVQVGPANARIQKHFTSLDEAKAFANANITEQFGAISLRSSSQP